MNKYEYECNNCPGGKSQGTCFLKDVDMEKDDTVPSVCPFDGDLAVWRRSPDPDPLTKAEDLPQDRQASGIVEAAETCWNEDSDDFDRELFLDIFHAIVAEMGAVRKEIEEINDNFTHSVVTIFDGSFFGEKFRHLQRQVESCVKHDPERLKEITEWREAVDRKVEEVQNDFYALNSMKKLNEEQPQPATKMADKPSGSAKPQALDSKGVPHDLIPGVSIYTLNIGPGYCERIFHHKDEHITYGYQVSGNKVCDGEFTPAPDPTGTVIWLRDLSFPATGTTGRES